ncbi:MAG: 50S ribosomal protein L11 methyltransferase [Planctomycetota bacterium]
MTPASPRVYELRGPDAAAALDWLHVHADVQGALEGDDALTVWLAGPLPALPFGGVAVRELAADPQAAAITGLEADRPIVVADDLLVGPRWVVGRGDLVGVEVVGPRGGAFGSGAHGSTQAALRCLHAMWDAPPTFADVGTGSGILALYARVRGCPRIAACDVEAASVAATRELLPDAEVLLGGAEALPAVHGMVANMTGDELRAAMPAMLARWQRSHALVLSGLRAHEVDGVAAMVGAPIAHRVTVGDFTSVGYRGGAR